MATYALVTRDAQRGPDYATRGYFLAFLLFWALIEWALGLQAPGDNYEQLDWVQHPAWGYSKHPPLPTLVLWLFARILPMGVPLTYFLGALEVGALLILAYALGRDTLGERRAWIGTLGITCVSYYTLRMHFYNHNTALLVACAAAMLCAWRAVHRGGTHWWLLLGLAWGAGFLSKYQMSLVVICNLVYFFSGAHRGRAGTFRGVALAAGVCAAVLLPHVVWLVQNHFPSFDYASKSLAASLPPAARVANIVGFCASQALRMLPATVLLGVLSALPHSETAAAPPRLDIEARRFWMIHAWGPLALMVGLAIFGGVDLQMHWGTAFLWALPLWFLTTRSSDRIATREPQFIFATVLVIQALLMAGEVVFPNA